MKITVEIEGRETLEELKKLKRRLSNLAIPLENYTRWFKKETDKQFDTEKDSDGLPWEKLKPYTLARKKRLGYPKKILTESGNTRQTLYHKSSKFEGEVGIKGNAGFHQDGTERLPERKIIGMNEQRENKLETTMYKWVNPR
ncbi:MAG: phage virion morphogenesis protein [Cyanobacteria bacterium J06628_3]